MTEEQVKQGNELLALIKETKSRLKQSQGREGIPRVFDVIYINCSTELEETIEQMSDNAASEIKAIIEKHYADVLNIAEQKFAEL